MNDHGLEQMIFFPTWEKNTVDLILPTLPGQFQDVHSPDKFSGHDIENEQVGLFNSLDYTWDKKEDLQEEGRFAGKIKLMQSQKRQTAANLDQNLKL